MSSTTWSKLRGRGPPDGFQLRKRELDGIEVRAVRGEEAEAGPDVFSRRWTSGCLWMARLSRTTTSPGRSVGASTCSTEARKMGLSRSPSQTAGVLQALDA